MRTVSVGGQMQRVPETTRELAGQSVAAAHKSLRMALAGDPGALSLKEQREIHRMLTKLFELAKDCGYEVRS